MAGTCMSAFLAFLHPRHAAGPMTGPSPMSAAPPAASSRCDCGALLVLLKRVQDDVAQLGLRGRVHDWPQQGEAAALAVDAVGPRREGHVPSSAVAALPDREAD